MGGNCPPKATIDPDRAQYYEISENFGILYYSQRGERVHSSESNAPWQGEKRRIGEAPQPLRYPLYNIYGRVAIGKKS